MLWKQTGPSVVTFTDGICVWDDVPVVSWLLFLWSSVSRLWPAADVQQGISNRHLVDIVIQTGNLLACHSADLPFRSC